jgi:hypothetical protein
VRPARVALVLLALASGPALWNRAVSSARAAAGPTSGGYPELEPPRYTREQMEALLAGAPPFRFVYGTLDAASTPILRARALALARRVFGGDSTQVVSDRDADARTLAAGPVFLLGSPRENEWTRRVASALPVRFGERGFVWQGKTYDQPLDAIHLSWANPYAPERFLLLSAGNSPAAMANRTNLVLYDEDWRIVRDGVLARSGRFAQDGGRPWRYEPRLDLDREAGRERFARSLVTTGSAALAVRSPAGFAGAAAVAERSESLLQRMGRDGLPAPAGAGRPTLTLYRSLEEKGALVLDTHAEDAGGGAPGEAKRIPGRAGSAALAAHAALPYGRESLDLWSVAALRLLQCGADPRSRFWVPAATGWAGRFEGEPLARAISRAYFGGVLPTAAEAASRDPAWRSPLVWTPARALLVRAVGEATRGAARREAWLSLLRADPPGSLDSLCRLAGVAAATVDRRYRALGDSLARVGRARTIARREPWRPADGFQRGVCLAHALGLERGYLSTSCARELQRVREAGADGISLTPFAWLADPREPALGNSSNVGPDGESDEAVCEAAARAHALGLRVWLKPHVWTRGWAGELAFGAADWRRFLSNYREAIVHWALLAEREDLEGLFVGHELGSSTAADPERWRALIGDVRRLYTGTLSYCANWDEAARVPLWDALDMIGVSL